MGKVQPECLSNMPEFYPTDLLACFTVESFACDKVTRNEPQLEEVEATLEEFPTQEKTARTRCCLVLRTPSPQEKLAWMTALQRSIPFSYTPFSEYMSQFGGKVQQNSQHSDGKYFSTFHFHLKFVKRVFGDLYQHYNRNHPHADKLWGKGVKGKIVR